MKSIFLALCFASLLVLASCQEEQASHEEARVQREVAQRVEVIRDEMKVNENRWHTVRVVAFCLLAGGSLIWLLQGDVSPPQGRGSNPSLTAGKPYESQGRRRVIDRPYDDHDDEQDDYPYRR